MDYWASEPSVKNVIRDKQVFVSFERCLRYKVDNTSSLVCEVISNFKCEGHDEANTKIAFFLCQLEEEKEIIIKCSDTDILVIILTHMEQLHRPTKKKTVGSGMETILFFCIFSR